MSPQKFDFSLRFQRRNILISPFLLAKSKKILVPQNGASRIVKCRFFGTSDSCFDRRSVLISRKAFGEILFSQTALCEALWPFKETTFFNNRPFSSRIPDRLPIIRRTSPALLPKKRWSSFASASSKITSSCWML